MVYFVHVFGLQTFVYVVYIVFILWYICLGGFQERLGLKLFCEPVF